MDNLFASVRLAAGSLLLCSVVYPATVWLFAHVFAMDQAEGSLVRNRTGEIVGSRLIAQKFTKAWYFRPRPSAADFDASAARGSNLAPSNPRLAERVRTDLAQLGGIAQSVPADLVTASGSGLDPHITAASAYVQVSRVARSRKADPYVVRAVVDQCAERICVGFVGERIVNVLTLNLELDRRFPIAVAKPVGNDRP